MSWYEMGEGRGAPLGTIEARSTAAPWETASTTTIPIITGHLLQPGTTTITRQPGTLLPARESASFTINRIGSRTTIPTITGHLLEEPPSCPDGGPAYRVTGPGGIPKEPPQWKCPTRRYHVREAPGGIVGQDVDPSNVPTDTGGGWGDDPDDVPYTENDYSYVPQREIPWLWIGIGAAVLAIGGALLLGR